MEYVISGNGQQVAVSHMQYADDTILVGDLTISNAWALKCILRNFELASGLKVNFQKSGLTCTKVGQALVDHAASILNCKVDYTSFKFLGILVGANPRRSRTRDPLINSL